MADLRAIALNILNNNPNLSNTQQTSFLQDGLNAIKNNDVQRGQQIANTILQTYGITEGQALQIGIQKGLI